MKTFFKEFQGYRAYKKLPKSYKKVVFYSESFQDWHHLKPLLNALLDDDIAVTYVTSDDKDPGLLKLSKKYRSIYIGIGFFMILFFQFLRAKLLILTMMEMMTCLSEKRMDALLFFKIKAALQLRYSN